MTEVIIFPSKQINLWMGLYREIKNNLLNRLSPHTAISWSLSFKFVERYENEFSFVCLSLRRDLDAGCGVMYYEQLERMSDYCKLKNTVSGVESYNRSIVVVQLGDIQR